MCYSLLNGLATGIEKLNQIDYIGQKYILRKLLLCKGLKNYSLALDVENKN